MAEKRSKKIILQALALAVFALLLVLIICRLYPLKYSDTVKENAKKYGLESSLVYAVIKTESGFNPLAVSGKNAMGLMQITEGTGEWAYRELNENGIFSKELLFEPEINIAIGCWYLNRLLIQYGDESLALAAYNAGSGNVSKWLNDPDYSDGVLLNNIPFKETEGFVKKVTAYKKIYEDFRGVK